MLFSRSQAEEYLSCFHFLAIMNNAAVSVLLVLLGINMSGIARVITLAIAKVITV